MCRLSDPPGLPRPRPGREGPAHCRGGRRVGARVRPGQAVSQQNLSLPVTDPPQSRALPAHTAGCQALPTSPRSRGAEGAWRSARGQGLQPDQWPGPGHSLGRPPGTPAFLGPLRPRGLDQVLIQGGRLQEPHLGSVPKRPFAPGVGFPPTPPGIRGVEDVRVRPWPMLSSPPGPAWSHPRSP